MQRLGIIDIGSNSIRLLLAEISDLGTYKVLDELKESIRLGADMIDGVLLNENRMKAAVATITLFKSYCDVMQVDEIIAVATEAVRRAKNKGEFLEKVKTATSISIRILSGEEEASYDCLGVAKSIYVHQCVIMDIGGASTELALMQNDIITHKIMIPFGAVNLTQRFNLEDEVNSSSENELKNFILDQFNDISWLEGIQADCLIGIGGTIRNVGKIDRALKNYPLDIHHNYRLQLQDVRAICNMVKAKNLKQRKKIDGLSKERADIFVAPVYALNLLMEKLKLNKFIISGKGVREGVLYDYIMGKYPVINDILDYSITNIIINHRLNIEHEKNVYRIAKTLFDELKELHDLDESFNNILKTASMLHDCGRNIRHYDNESHTFYTILNSELNGLTHKELVMSAFTAAFNGSKFKGPSFSQFTGLIDKSDLVNAEKLGLLVRISDNLDKGMRGIIQNLHCKINDNSVILKIDTSSDAALEIRHAEKYSDSFYNMFGRELIIQS